MPKPATYLQRVVNAVKQSDKDIISFDEIVAHVNSADGSKIDYLTIGAISKALKKGLLIKHQVDGVKNLIKGHNYGLA
jgi:hypothetical protein